MSSRVRLAHRFHDTLRLLVRESLARDRMLCAQAQLSPTQWETLDVLWERGTAGMNELAEELRLSQSTLTRVVDLLEKKNLARRRAARGDRRRVEVTLSTAGEELHQRVLDRLQASCREILSSLPLAQRQGALEGIQGLARATQQWVDRQRPNRGPQPLTHSPLE